MLLYDDNRIGEDYQAILFSNIQILQKNMIAGKNLYKDKAKRELAIKSFGKQ